MQGIVLFRQILAVLLRSSPNEMTSIMLSSLLSKISSLLALFLPFKIILLIGQDNIPSYFPTEISRFDKNSIIIGLCGLTLIFYLLHVVFELFIERCQKKGARKFLDTVGSLEMSKRELGIAHMVFLRVSKSAAELVFSLGVLLFLMFIHPSLFFLTLIYIILVLSGYMLIANNQKAEEQVLMEHNFQNDARKNIWFDIGFLLAFIFIVWELLSDTNLNVITALISFLLLRQSSGGLKRVTADISFLKKQRVFVDVLKPKSI